MFEQYERRVLKHAHACMRMSKSLQMRTDSMMDCWHTQRSEATGNMVTKLLQIILTQLHRDIDVHGNRMA